MYTVIGGTQGRALRVMWMLEELGQTYRRIAAPPASSRVVAMNPAGRPPVMVEDDTPIADSTAILSYLADKHGRLTHPAGTLGRARQDSMTQFLLDEFDAALWMAARHSSVLPEALRKAAIGDSLRCEFERSQKTLVSRMSDGPYLMGGDMTVPDIILTHCGIWADSAGFPISERRLAAYLSRMKMRSALLRALEN